MTRAEARPRSPRLLGVVCVALVGASAALWGASTATWFSVTASVAGRGEQVVPFTGAQLRPSLGGVALLALAGVAGLVATGGPLRRLVGGLLGLAGAGVGWLGVSGLLVDPFAGDGPDSTLPTPPPGVTVDALRDAPAAVTPAPWLAVLAGLLLLAAGLAVLAREPSLPRLGARYAAPGARRPPADPDRAAWAALDDGTDPTVGGQVGDDGPNGTGGGPPDGRG